MTAGPAISIVTSQAQTTCTARGSTWPSRRLAGKTFGTDGFCPPSVTTCVTPATLSAINPADVPDVLNRYSGTAGFPVVKDRTFFFATGDYTRQDRTTFLSPSLPSFVLPPDGNLAYVGNYRQGLINARVDQKISPSQTLMVRMNYDHFYDTNPNDAVGGTSAPSVARQYTRGAITGQGNLTSIFGPNVVNEARFSYLDGDPVTRWEAQTLSTAYTRAGSVPFTIGQSRLTDAFSHQASFSDTLSWQRGKQSIRLGGSFAHHTSGGMGNEPGFAVLGTFTFLNTTTAPFDQLKLTDVQQHAADQLRGHHLQPRSVADRRLRAGQRPREQRPHADLGLRYDVQTLTTRRTTSRRASASAGIRTVTRAWRSAAATACTTRRFSRT